MSDRSHSALSPTLAIAGLILLAALSRVLPHPPNFTPLEAMGLFAGAALLDWRKAMLIPLAAMALSDIGLALVHGFDYGFHSGLPLIYALIALNVLVGRRFLSTQSSVTRIGLTGLSAVLCFWIASNFAVWLGGTMYPLNGAGLVACYVAALPFLGNALAGMALYATLLFGAHRMVVARTAQPTAI